MTTNAEHIRLPSEPVAKEFLKDDPVERRARQVHYKLMQVLSSPHRNGELADALTRLREGDPSYLSEESGDGADVSFDAFARTWMKLKPSRQGTVEEKINRACNAMRATAAAGLVNGKH